jgi:hypothetical protein
MSIRPAQLQALTHGALAHVGGLDEGLRHLEQGTHPELE